MSWIKIEKRTKGKLLKVKQQWIPFQTRGECVLANSTAISLKQKPAVRVRSNLLECNHYWVGSITWVHYFTQTMGGSASHTSALWCLQSSPCKGLQHQLLSAHRNPTAINEKWAYPATLKVQSNWQSFSLSLFWQVESPFSMPHLPYPRGQAPVFLCSFLPSTHHWPSHHWRWELSPVYRGVFWFCSRLQ